MNLMKERLWPAGAAAFALHSLAISALALSMMPSQPGEPEALIHHFHVDMVFHQENQAETMAHQCPVYSREETLEDHNNQAVTAISFHKPLKKSVQNKAPQGRQTHVSTPSITVSETNNSLPVFNPPPVYPREALRKKIQGVVMVRASLSEEGSVREATTVPPRMDPILEDAALKAIQKWRFKPGMRTVEVPIEFKLVV